MLAARGLRVVAGRKCLLALDSLQLQAGDFTAVIGPNGAGKSTLLQVLAGGVLRPEQGDIRLQGVPLQQWSAAALAMQRSWLPQRVELAWEYRVSEVLALACWQRPDTERTQVLDLIRNSWELDDCWERPCNSLSGGEQRRVHLARSVAQILPGLQRGEPALLLLDEPIAHLDPALERWALEKLSTLVDQGAAVLCVLHDINLAARHASQLLALRGGELLAQGAPARVLTEELLGRLYDVPFTRLDGAEGSAWFVPQAGRSGQAVP